MTQENVIAIDGVSYAGKSTIAKSLAVLTGYTYINTGHMYRATAKLAEAQNISLDDAVKVGEIAGALTIEFKNSSGDCLTFVNGEDLTETLNHYDLVQGASVVATLAPVRAILTEMQRNYAKSEIIIMEGRDIGTCVFPNAKQKFFITASEDVRAKRMWKTMSPSEREGYSNASQLVEKIQELDERDHHRKVSPLRIAEDAIVYDNSDSPSQDQDAIILQYYLNHQGELCKNAALLGKLGLKPQGSN